MSVLSNILRVVAFFGFAMFCFCYHFLAPWWRSDIGRNLMTWAGAPAVLLGLGIVRDLWPGAWFTDVLRPLVFLVLIFAVYRRIALLLKAQRRNHEDVTAP